MAKVFRLHTGAADTLSNWEDSVKLGSTAIDRIPDPVGAADSHEITSIPSPFARIDLVKTAFKYVADNGIDGNTIYHKLVSDTLDVGQIFFNIEKYRNTVEIIVWDKVRALNELEESTDEHKRLGRTYDTFLQQDQDVYHFNKMDCIYLLNYKAPTAPKVMNIIGATSPATLFFTSANDLRFVGRGEYAITFGKDRPFDDDYLPLYKRDDAYVKYWWSMKKGIPNFPVLFPEVNSYLDKCYPRLSESLKEAILNLKDDSYRQDYDDISVVPTGQEYVKVFNQRIKGKKVVDEVDSDFVMRVSLPRSGEKIPLALPVETFTEPWRYVIDSWNKDTHVPYSDSRPIAGRTLPEDGTAYPYVTVSDFLENSIVRVPYRFNKDAFFNGNDENPDASDSYLLPVKRTFFDYFRAEDLKGNVDGRKMIEIKRLAGGTGVKVILRIPTKAGHIQYERIYYKGANPDVKNNKGAIVTREFTVCQFPAMRYAEGVKPYYRVGVLDRDTVSSDENNRYKLAFYDKSNGAVGCEGIVQRNKNSDGARYDRFKVDSAIYVLSKTFQYIHLTDESNQRLSAVILPEFPVKTGNHRFRFAIDFGTTNTHIEYSVDGENLKAFNITEADMQIQKLHVIEDFELNDVLRSDFIAATIGGESIYSYPMRTVLSETNNTNWSRPVYSMAHANIPYTYEKSLPLSYNVIHTDLKWSTIPDDKKRAEMYIECLLIMLRNKVLLNNGDLSRTEIVWFYPASMTRNRFEKFKKQWKDSFQELFHAPAGNIIEMSESIAPYYFHERKGARSTVVSIDIGGGTTDVLVLDNDDPKFLTSFRFAANSVFGDGYSYDADSNGFVQKYSEEIRHLLEENHLTGLMGVLQSLLEKKKSSDIIAFFFSLTTNKEVKNVIDFGGMLSDDKKGKYAVILFYAAIIYHIASMMKAKGFSMPRCITFSGNGSKLLNILSASDSTLERFTKLIFEKLYGTAYPSDGLSIIRPDNSKESTCKGGVIHEPFRAQEYNEINEMKTILLGCDATSFAASSLSYDDLDDEVIDNVVSTVKGFIDFVFALDRDFSFYQEFDVDSSICDKVKNLCTKDVKTYLEKGISIKKNMLNLEGADKTIEETLFFYPLVGILNTVVREVYSL